jgi:hypothetical protein
MNRLHGGRNYQEIFFPHGISVKEAIARVHIVFLVCGFFGIFCGIWSFKTMHSFLEFFRCVVGDKLITEHQQHVQPEVMQQFACILIVTGALVSLKCFLVCIGAYRVSKYFLIGYGLFDIIIALLEITALILAATCTLEPEENSRALLKSSIKEYYAVEEKDAVTLMWDNEMANSKCCGVDSYEDFEESKKLTEGNKKKIPDACCILEGGVSKLRPKDPNCTQNPSDANSYWKKGCYKTKISLVQEPMVIAVIFCGASAVYKFLFIISVSFYLCTPLQAGGNIRVRSAASRRG